METCVGLHIECGILIKGGLGVAMGFVLFIGSVYVLLTAVFGRWMAYLVTAVTFFGWMAILSSVWLFGFFSQGPETPTNLGPQGSLPGWTIVSSGLEPVAVRYDTFLTFPSGDEWREPGTNKNDTASVQGVQGVVQQFLADSANADLGITDPGLDPNALLPAQFTVDDVKFATAPDGKTPLAAAHGFFSGGGPQFTVQLYHDSGSVPRYSYMFLIGSILLFGAHLPLLDKAEKKRKEFLTGGAAPAWYGPA